MVCGMKTLDAGRKSSEKRSNIVRNLEKVMDVAVVQWADSGDPTVVLKLGEKQFEPVKMKNLTPETLEKFEIAAIYGLSKREVYNEVFKTLHIEHNGRIVSFDRYQLEQEILFGKGMGEN